MERDLNHINLSKNVRFVGVSQGVMSDPCGIFLLLKPTLKGNQMFTLDLRDVETPCSTISLKEADKLFFSESPKRIAVAKAMCNECPLTSNCLQFALEEKIEFGIFGGTTPQERKVML